MNTLLITLVEKVKAALSGTLSDVEGCYNEVAALLGHKTFRESDRDRAANGQWTTSGGAGGGAYYDKETSKWIDGITKKPLPKAIQARINAIPQIHKGHVGVRVNPDPTLPLLAVANPWIAKERRMGNQKWIYSDAHKVKQYKAKWVALKAFNKVKTEVQGVAYKDALEGKPAAQALYVIDQTAIRVGNGRKANKTTGTYGVTDLKVSHVKVRGTTVMFSFPGKGGKMWTKNYTSAKLATVIRGAMTAKDGSDKKKSDRLFEVSGETVNTYLRDVAGEDSKEFAHAHSYRHWWATIQAVGYLKSQPAPTTKDEAVALKKAACLAAADFLNDTEDMVYQTYVAPSTWKDWGDGILPPAPKLHRKAAKLKIEMDATTAQNLMDEFLDSYIFPDFGDDEDKSTFLELMPDPDAEGFVPEDAYDGLVFGSKGVWRTVRGSRVYIEEGQTAEEAIAARGKPEPKPTPKPKPKKTAQIEGHRSIVKEWLASVGDEDAEAIKDRAMGAYRKSFARFKKGMRGTNRKLRSGEELSPDERKAVTQVESLMRPASKDIKVFRGQNERPARLNDMLESGGFMDKGIISTTADQLTTEEFLFGDEARRGKTRQHVVYHITIKAGQKFLPIEEVYEDDLSDNLREEEVVLPKGTKFAVTNYEATDYPASIYDAAYKVHNVFVETVVSSTKPTGKKKLEPADEGWDYELLPLPKGEKKYDPTQRRDRTGQWVRDKPEVAARKVRVNAAKKELKAYLNNWSGKPASPDADDTFGRYRDSEGNVTPERKELHRLIKGYFKAHATPVENPQSYLMGGGPAAGKSTLAKSGLVDIPDNRLLSNPDDIKDFLPEYMNSAELQDPKLATVVHEESSALATELLEEGIAESMNVMLDATGNTDYGRILEVSAKLKVNGRKLNAHYVSCPAEEAHRRNEDRFKETGRLVPASYLSDVHRNVSLLVPILVAEGRFDTITVHDTFNETGKPQLLLTGAGTTFEIHNEKLWKRFIDKGRGTKAIKPRDTMQAMVDYVLGRESKATPLSDALKADIDDIIARGGIVELPMDWQA